MSESKVTKLCSACGQVKPRNQFSGRQSPDGKHWYLSQHCMPCTAAIARAKRAELKAQKEKGKSHA